MAMRISALLLLLLLFSPAPGQGQNGAPPETTPTLDEVLITGVQPGPRLWKVSKDGHALWILGSYGPLPKKMSWRSQEVESIIAKSQELLTSVNIRPKIGFFSGLRLLPSLIGVRANPDGARLKDVVPGDLYARWLVLKTRYIGSDNSAEKWRPIFAAYELYGKAIDRIGLQSRDVVWPVVEKAANQHHLKWIKPSVALEIDKPGAKIREFKKSPLDDVECFSRTIERLETDLDLMRVRANAWAVGNVAELRKYTHIDQASACIAAVMNSEFAQDVGMRKLSSQTAAAWIAAAEGALARNTSTFAVLSIDEILKPDGYVARLRAQGYAVEEP